MDPNMLPPYHMDTHIRAWYNKHFSTHARILACTQTHISGLWNSLAILSPLDHWGHLTLWRLNALRLARWLHFPSQLAQLHNPPWNECINSICSAGENTFHCLQMIPAEIYIIDTIATRCLANMKLITAMGKELNRMSLKALHVTFINPLVSWIRIHQGPLVRTLPGKRRSRRVYKLRESLRA